jgi:hypothetical protein
MSINIKLNRLVFSIALPGMVLAGTAVRLASIGRAEPAARTASGAME